MKNEKILYWSITIMLMSLVFGEAFIRYFVELKAIPFALATRFVLYYNTYGIWVRLGSFSILWVFFYTSRKQSLAEKYAVTPRKTLSQEYAKYLIVSYVFCGIVGLFAIYLPFPLLTFLVYLAVFILGFLFSYFTVKEIERVETDRKKNQTKYSLHLKGDNGKQVNITNPFRGILVIGSNGGGKTVSTAEPFIEQFAQKNYAGIIYDYKFPTLSDIAYLHFSTKRKVDAGEIQPIFYVVNFSDISKSHRFNPLNPKYLKSQIYATEFAKALVVNFNTESNQKSDFWVKSSTAFLTAIIWFLKKHHPLNCTIPHLVSIITGFSYRDTMAMLETDDECSKIIRSVLTARDERAGNQLSGVVSSLQIDFATLNDPNLTYVLSGDDFDLNINDPKHPKVLCVGTDNHIAAALSPIISLIFSVALKQMNEHSKHHSFCLLDEAAQINIPRLSNVPATCRSNKLSVIFMAQNLTQIEDKYGKAEAESLLANLNYQFFTRTTVFSTAEYISKMIGETKSVAKSENQSHSSKGLNTSNNSIGDNFSEVEKRAVKPQDVLNLQAGEIVGIRAIEPSDIKAGTVIPTFKMKVIREVFSTIEGMNGAYKKDGSFQTNSKPIPSFNAQLDIEKLTNKITEDCRKMLNIS
jgi:hypothetical protein